MLIVILIISIVLMVLGSYFYDMYNADFGGTSMITAGVIGLICSILGFLLVVGCYISNPNIDAKISMYQEENKNIEEKIEVTVKQYMGFEKDTYKNLKVDSYINLVNTYPKLKSDKLIQQQIKTYNKNSEEIKSLKLEKLNQQAYKWWLHFGG